jgi:hypothetical protein
MQTNKNKGIMEKIIDFGRFGKGNGKNGTK